MRTATAIQHGRVRARRANPFPIAIPPAETDLRVARAVARNAKPAPQHILRALSWGADEKVLLVLAAAGWIVSRGSSEPVRRAGNHALLVTAAVSLLPHGLKLMFNQTRPDRRTVVGLVNGVSFSGKRRDAFPSGHALHMGAVASAASTLQPGPRRAIQALAVGISMARIAVMAHWPSDVVAGFALGALVERLLRRWVGYPFATSHHDDQPSPKALKECESSGPPRKLWARAK
jgi:undecaprenyl-diphosphatase